MRIGRKTIIGIITVVVLVLVGGYYGLGYYIFGQVTTIHPECGVHWMADKINNTPTEFVSQFRIADPTEDVPNLWMASYEDVTFPSREDDVTIAGWFIPAVETSDYTVIVVHGVNGCKRDSTVLLPASMLHRNGFNVLMIDLRNHGDSDITTGRMSAGNEEYKDVLGAFDYLQSQGYEADNIGVMGLSMGAATSAIAFGEEPAIPAVWLDSPFDNIGSVVVAEVNKAGLPGNLVSPAFFQVASLNGINFSENNPATAIQNHNGRPIYIVHGDADNQVPVEAGQTVYENAGDNATFLAFEGLEHVQGVYAAENYEAELIAFFTAHLIDAE